MIFRNLLCAPSLQPTPHPSPPTHTHTYHPPLVQELAVDLLFHFPAASEQVLRAAALVCLGDAYPPSTAARLLDVLSAKAAAGAADPGAFCGLLLNVLSGRSAAGPRQRSWARHEALAGAACRAALALGAPADVGAALLPPLLAACGADCATGTGSSSNGSSGSSGSPWAAYGLLQLTLTLAQAAAAAQHAWQPPPEVSAALPGLMLHLQLSCQRQQQDASADPPPPGSAADGTAGSSDAPPVMLSTQQASALCLRLLSLQPTPLLPQLLAAVAGGVQADAWLLPAALHLLLALLREPGLRAALLEEQAGVQGAVAACRAAAEAAGGATLGGRGCQEQLRQAEGLCAAVLGAA